MRTSVAALAAGVALTIVAVAAAAPDFALPAAPGAPPVKLADLTAKGPVVIYTFIQAFTGT